MEQKNFCIHIYINKIYSSNLGTGKWDMLTLLDVNNFTACKIVTYKYVSRMDLRCLPMICVIFCLKYYRHLTKSFGKSMTDQFKTLQVQYFNQPFLLVSPTLFVKWSPMECIPETQCFLWEVKFSRVCYSEYSVGLMLDVTKLAWWHAKPPHSKQL